MKFVNKKKMNLVCERKMKQTYEWDGKYQKETLKILYIRISVGMLHTKKKTFFPSYMWKGNHRKNGNCLFWFSSSGKFAKKRHQFQSQTKYSLLLYFFLFFHMLRIYFFSVLVLCLPLLVSVLTLVEFSTKKFSDRRKKWQEK